MTALSTKQLGEAGTLPPPSTMDDVTLWSVKQVCEALGVGRNFVYERLATGELEAVRFGTKIVRVPVASVRAYVARGKSESAA